MSTKINQKFQNEELRHQYFYLQNKYNLLKKLAKTDSEKLQEMLIRLFGCGIMNNMSNSFIRECLMDKRFTRHIDCDENEEMYALQKELLKSDSD